MVRRKRRIIRAVRALMPRGTKLSPYAFAHALGLISVIALLFYALMSWLGDYDPSIILQQYPITFSFNSWTILIGLVQTYVLSYIGGWIFVKIYNKSTR